MWVTFGKIQKNSSISIDNGHEEDDDEYETNTMQEEEMEQVHGVVVESVEEERWRYHHDYGNDTVSVGTGCRVYVTANKSFARTSQSIQCCQKDVVGSRMESQMVRKTMGKITKYDSIRIQAKETGRSNTFRGAQNV